MKFDYGISTEEIYLVHACGGEYEDAWDNILGAFVSEAKADKAVRLLNDRACSYEKFSSELYELGLEDECSVDRTRYYLKAVPICDIYDYLVDDQL